MIWALLGILVLVLADLIMQVETLLEVIQVRKSTQQAAQCASRAAEHAQLIVKVLEEMERTRGIGQRHLS